MEELSQTPFSQLTIPLDAQVQIKNKTIFLTNFNWEFKECEKFQQAVNQIITKNRDYRFFIFTNHPHVFTLGRGNERDVENLVDFDPTLEKSLSFPVHKIHRGGGITFHYPGQWIFYPLCSISQRYTLEDHMCWVLKATSKAITEVYDVQNLLSAKKLMGIWYEKQKLASIGVGLHRYVSIHGLALNFHDDKKMFDELKKINPCGLNPTTYTCLDKIVDQLDLDQFTHAFIDAN